MTVKDLLPMEIDVDVYDDVVEEIDVDVYDDVVEEIGIAFCGPMKLTCEGKKEFKEVLEYPITLYVDYALCVVHIDGEGWKEKLAKVKKFFYSLAGYCDDEDFERWFRIV